jgi:hypothetical protein
MTPAGQETTILIKKRGAAMPKIIKTVKLGGQKTTVEARQNMPIQGAIARMHFGIQN